MQMVRHRGQQRQQHRQYDEVERTREKIVAGIVGKRWYRDAWFLVALAALVAPNVGRSQKVHSKHFQRALLVRIVVTLRKASQKIFYSRIKNEC